MFIQIDRPRRFNIGFNELEMFATLTNSSTLDEALGKISGSVNITALKSFIYCGFYKDKEGLTLDMVGDFLTDEFKKDRLLSVLDKIKTALEECGFTGDTNEKKLKQKKA